MTKKQLIKDWTETIKDLIVEVKYYDFKDDAPNDIDTEDFYQVLNERLWEAIDGCEDVIYTYHAKQVVDALDVDVFGCCDRTGDRYTSWGHAAFSGIYEMIQEEIDIDTFINIYLESLIEEEE